MTKAKDPEVVPPERALVPGGSSYVVLGENSERSLEIIRDTLAEFVSSQFQLLQLRVPTSGGKLWQYDGPAGPVGKPDLDCVVLGYVGRQKAYYRAPIGEGAGNQPPDCKSTDGITGFGSNTWEASADSHHDCLSCPMNQFGSSKKGKGKACSDKAFVFLMFPDERLPRLLPVPATSLKGFQQYMLALANQGVRPHEVVTKLRLKEAKSDAGVKYSTIEPVIVGKLSPDQASFFGVIAAQIKRDVRPDQMHAAEARDVTQ